MRVQEEACAGGILYRRKRVLEEERGKRQEERGRLRRKRLPIANQPGI